MADLIVDQSQLAELAEELAGVDRYAIDTEFHRERTYFPQVALLQVAWNESVAIVDPLEVDATALAKVMDGPGLCVLHAGIQDLEVIELACGTVPSRLFDTQIGAGFLGVATGSLVSLLDRYLGITIPKGDRLTDWMRRPLTDDQLAYAAGDVLHLLELTDVIVEKLTELNRQSWADEESALLLDRPRNRRSPDDAVLRIKEARALKGQTHRIARAVAAWREQRAANLDVPVRQILPDIAVVAIAQQGPSSVAALNDIRGIDGRHVRKGADREILAAVEAGRQADGNDEPVVTRPPDLPRELRPVVTLVTSWISQIARDAKLDPALLATRADVEALLRGDDSRLNHGWRADLAGAPIRHLVDGDAAIAFDGGGRLVLEARSHQPYGS